MSEKKHTCSTCMYFHKEHGECRRGCATVHLSSGDEIVTSWPEVASTDWCGEHPDNHLDRMVFHAKEAQRRLAPFVASPVPGVAGPGGGVIIR